MEALAFLFTDLLEFLWGRFENAQSLALALRIQTGHGFAQGHRFILIKPQPLCYNCRPERQHGRSNQNQEA